MKRKKKKKKSAEIQNSKFARTKNGRIMLSSKSAVCDITASSKIPLVGPFFVLVVLNKLILGRNELDKACF